MNEIVLSIVIPAHNEEENIEKTLECINKVLNILQISYEVIVVCDSCNDQTFNLAKKYTKKVIKVKHKNRGATRNSGANIACGQYLLFVDADTLITTKSILEGLNVLENSEYAMVGSTWNGDNNRVRGAALFENIVNKYLKITNTIPGYFQMCRRNQFLEYDPESHVEDVMFSKKMRIFGKIYYLSNPDIITSNRRIENDGFIKTVIHYICKDTIIDAIKIIIFFVLIICLIKII